jgi:hypothetical protein
MNAAGYILTGMRKHRRRAHSPMILAHSLSNDFFGIEVREGWFPDFESFAVWVACRASPARRAESGDHRRRRAGDLV